MTLVIQTVPQSTHENAVLIWMVRHRRVIFSFVTLFLILSFNGRWRLGRDSSLYRGLGHSLAHGQGYAFQGEKNSLALPGLPLLLAAEEKLMGIGPQLTHDQIHRPVFPVLVMVAMAAMTLVAVYHLMLMYFPPWAAVWVTAALGINWSFLEHANELMTDMPFLLALCLVLLGYGLMRRAKETPPKLRAMMLLATGLGIAASMRPTVIGLAAAIGLACVWHILRGNDRRSHAFVLGLLALMMIAAVALDPRENPHKAQKGYAQSLVRKVKGLIATASDSADQEEIKARNQRPTRGIAKTMRRQPALMWSGLAISAALIGYGVWRGRQFRSWELAVAGLGIAFAIFSTGLEETPVVRMLRHHIPYAMFGMELWHFGIIVSVLVLAAAIATARHEPLWGLLVLMSAIMFAVFASVPRYFLMLMPLLLLGWGLRMNYLQKLIPRRFYLPELFVVASMGIVIVPSLGKSATIIMEQHGLTFASKQSPVGGQRIARFLPVVKADFLRVYRDGKFYDLCEISDVIREKAPAGVSVIGPEPQIMTYISGHRVVLLRDLRKGSPLETPQVEARRLKLRWAVFPPEIYRDLENPEPGKLPLTCGFLSKNVILEEPTFAASALWLQKFTVRGGLPSTRKSTTSPSG